MSVDRDTFKHAAIYSGAAMLSRILGFLLLPFYTHVLRGVGYGIIGMIDTALSFLMSLLGQSIRGGTVRIYHEQETEEKKNLVVSTGAILMLGVGGALVTLTMLFARPIASFLLADGDLWYVVCLGLIAFLFDLSGETAASVLIIRRRSAHYSLVSLMRLLLGMAANIWLVLVLKMGVLGYFIASAGVAFLSCIVLWIIMVRTCGLGFDRDIARQLIVFQLPLIPGSIASFLARQAERVLVRFVIALESVGVLEIAYKFPVLLTLLIHQPFMRSWDTGRVQIAEESDGPQRIGRMFTYALFLITTAGLIMAVCIENVLRMLTPEEFWIAHRIAKVEILTVILQSTVYHLNFGIFYVKATKDWAKVRGVMSFVKVGLSVFFIWMWGLMGAAFSALITAAITLVWGGSIGQRHYRIDLERAKIMAIVGVATVYFVLLVGADFTTAGWLAPVRDSWMPGLVEAVRGTFLGTWKEGKVVVMLAERSDLIVDTAVKFLIAATFVLLLPAVHDPTRKKLLRRG